MSHLADALRRANRTVIAADAFREDDHPWGDALGQAAVDAAEHGSGSEGRSGEADPQSGAAAPHPPPRPLRPVAGPAFVDDTRTAATAAPGARPQIAGLVERVFLPTSGPAPRVVAFASVDDDASSSRVAAAAGDMLAQRTGARVGVIDLDFGDPSVHEHFAVPKTPGLIEALASDAPLVGAARQVRANLWVVPAGNSHGGAELSAGSRTRLSHLLDAFDYAVIVLEPLAESSGAGLATIAHGVVLVVNAETTRRDTGRTVTERLQSSGAAILGAVLTNRRYPIPDAIYRRL